jgi:hypothetical protein
MAGWFWSSGTTWRQECLKAEKALLESITWKGASFECHDTPIHFRGEQQHIRTIVASAAPSTASGEFGSDAAGEFRVVGRSKENIPLVLWHGFGQGEKDNSVC